MVPTAKRITETMNLIIVPTASSSVKVYIVPSKHGWLPFLLWRKQMHYFMGCTAAIRGVK